MIIREEDGRQFTIVLNRDELGLLNNALNEVCNGIDGCEFSTRLGSEREAAKEMLDVIHRALD